MNAIYDLFLMVYTQLYEYLYTGLLLIPLMNAEVVVGITVINLASLIASSIVLGITFAVALFPIMMILSFSKRLLKL
jgi:hypothetical protein